MISGVTWRHTADFPPIFHCYFAFKNRSTAFTAESLALEDEKAKAQVT
jgi:hypothetical protein